MLIKDRFESNLQEIKALEELLDESNSKLKAYNVEAEPLNKKLQELYVKYDCRKINENLREIPKKIEALKKEHYFYFTESILKFMLKLEEHDKYPYFDVDILIFKLEEDLDNLKQKLEEDPDYIEYQRLKEKFGS